MSLYMPLLALVNNDNAYYFDITFNGEPLPLGNYTTKVYRKASSNALDNTATVYQVGSGLTIQNAALGKVKLVFPHTDLPTPGTQWWRLDVIDTNNAPYTVFYGALTIKAV